MGLNRLIKKAIRETDMDALTPGTPEFFQAQRAIILRKPMLKNSYLQFYRNFVADLEPTSGLGAKKLLELGSGGGFLKEVVPDVITSDVYAKVADLTVDARSLPFANEEVRGIFMASVLHHIPEVRKFFAEADRVLCPGGICAIVEPCSTPFAKLFYRWFHHEPFLPNAKEWEFQQGNAMLDSNQALSWIIFARDFDRFQSEFPRLRVEKKVFLPTLSYLASGGVNYKPLIPQRLNKLVGAAENAFAVANRWLSLAWYILIRKQP